MTRTGLWLSVASICLASHPAVAGPCTDRVAQLEKAVTANFEGAGPALAGAVQSSSASGTGQPGTGGQAVGPAGGGAGATAGRSLQSGDENKAMNLLNQAKILDKDGKESECMRIVSQVETMVQPARR